MSAEVIMSAARGRRRERARERRRWCVEIAAMSSDEDVVERERELVGLARVRAQQARHTSYSVSVLANSPMSKVSESTRVRRSQREDRGRMGLRVQVERPAPSSGR